MRLIDLAPHASLPPLMGADKRAWHLFQGLIDQGVEGSFIGRTALVQSGCDPVPHSPARSWRDRKSVVALLAFATGRDYWGLRHILPGARHALLQAVQKPYETVILNFLFTLGLLEAVPRPYRLLVETHDYDPAAYRALTYRTRNPIIRALCHRGAAISERALRALPQGTVLVHVSEDDASRYREHRPDLEHVVVENGTTVRPRKRVPDYTVPSRRVLLFVGALSVKMNQDALMYFSERFWPSLREHAEFRVAGSAPPDSVRKLCSQQGWTLLPNQSEEDLERLYGEAHFAVLPFAYGAGSKLKLFEACGRGVPLLATRAGVVGVLAPPPLVTVGDEPSVWQKHITACCELPEQAVRNTIAFADRFAWPRLASRLAKLAQQSPLID